MAKLREFTTITVDGVQPARLRKHACKTAALHRSPARSAHGGAAAKNPVRPGAA